MIKEAMDLGPTLAVWLFDNTASAYAMTSEVGVAARRFEGTQRFEQERRGAVDRRVD